MNRLFVFLFLFIVACSPNSNQEKGKHSSKEEPITVSTEAYDLIVPQKQNGLLVLFPCFPCDAENTRSELDIEKLAISNGLAVLFMNFNQHLWLTEKEKEELENTIAVAIEKNKINTDNTFIGGFSSGGNTSLLLTNYLVETKSHIQPKGLFIVDSPLDLLALYEAAQITIEKDFSDIAIEEAKWIIDQFEAEFGKGDSSLVHYEMKSPYLSKIHSLKNLSHLNQLKVRLYSEPDSTWWMENRQTPYEHTNSRYIEQLAKDFKAEHGEESIAYIPTENRGYRANGDRHPHSWSIVDKEDLIQWIFEDQKTNQP